jgi:hypothetical protein
MKRAGLWTRMVYLKMLRALALIRYENKLYWKSLSAEIAQQYGMGIEIF